MRKRRVDPWLYGKDYRTPEQLWGAILTLLMIVLFVVSIVYGWFLLMVVLMLVLAILFFMMFRVTAGMRDKRRYSFPIISLGLFGFFLFYLLDVPYDLRHQYAIVEGVPSRTEEIADKEGNEIGANVWIQNHEFTLRGEYQAVVYDKWIIVHYYPHTGYMVDYQVLSADETAKKLQR